VIFEDRRDALRLIDCRQLEVTLFLGFLNAPFDVTNRFRVFIDLDLIVRTELPLEACQLFGDRVQDALVLQQAPFARAALGAATVAKELLEHRSRVVLHRQGLRGAAPRDCVRVGAAQVAGAGTRVGRGIHRELEGGDLRLLGELPGEQLVHRHVRDNLHLVTPAAGRARQEGSGGARVNVVPVGLETRQHEHLIAERCQRLQDGRELEDASLTLRRPVFHCHPVRHVEGLEPVHRPATGPAVQRKRGEHRLEQRERHRGAEPSQNSPPRQRFPGEERHISSP
jgi:hypothetical protein